MATDSPRSRRVGRAQLKLVTLFALIAALAVPMVARQDASAQTSPYVSQMPAFDPNVAQVFIAQGIPTSLSTAATTDGGDVEFTPIGLPLAKLYGDTSSRTYGYNSVGYNLRDDYLYAVLSDTGKNDPVVAAAYQSIVRVGPNNEFEFVKNAAGNNIKIPLFPNSPNGGANNGAFSDDDGYFYVGAGRSNLVQVYDIPKDAPAKFVKTVTLYGDSKPLATGGGIINEYLGKDIVFSQGYFWSFFGTHTNVTTGALEPPLMSRMNPDTGEVRHFVIPEYGLEPLNAQFGAVWKYGNGTIGVSKNEDGNVYNLTIDASTTPPTYVLETPQDGPPNGNNDGTSNPGPEIDLAVNKSAQRIQANVDGSLTYIVTVTNNDPLYFSSGYRLKDTLPAGFLNPVSPDAACSLTPNATDPNRTDWNCFGSKLAAGESRTFTVTGYLDPALASDECITNTAEVIGNEIDPVPDNNKDDALVCPQDLAIEKSAEKIGTDTVKFTVKVKNISEAAYTKAYPAIFVDDLSDVLDDMDFNNDVVTTYDGPSNPAEATSSLTGTDLTWKGPLFGYETATITYSATIKDGGTFDGDWTANNKACIDTPEIPITDGVCSTTTTPFDPNLVVSKSVFPTDGSAVKEGDTVKYTLTFDNSTGEAPAEVDYSDDWTGVIDDATVTVSPTSSDPTNLAVSAVTGKGFDITGFVPEQSTITVTYEVVVNGLDQRGDNDLVNFVLPPGTTTPGTCVAGDPLCTENPIAQLVVSKDVNPADGSTVNTGDNLTYTLTFDNSAGKASAPIDYVDDWSGVVDDAALQIAPISSDPAITIPTVTPTNFTIKGTLAAGATATVTYTVKVNPEADRGDNVLQNFLLTPGTPTPETCAPGDPLCTENPIPELKVMKSVDPADGSTVAAGDTLTYTLTFDNTGGMAPAPVDYYDNWAGIADDATVTVQPAASDPALAISSVTTTGFAVKGTLDPGKVVKVTYSVKVKPDAERGDSVLLNFLLKPGVTPPPICVVGDPLCTENPVPALVVSKSVNPADGTSVTAGQALTYTLTFDNSAGGADATVNYVDDWSGVLDDASVTAQPTSSTPSLTVGSITPTDFAVTGTVAAGAKATVTYTVIVKADGQRNDNLLQNFLLPPGVPPPDICEVGDPLCTENPVPQLVVNKSVDPADGSTVEAGEVLTYTLTFDNSLGGAAAPVNYVDNWAGVLDDALVSSQPVSSDAALTVSNVTNTSFAVKGSLDPGKVVTVTYQVTVKADGARGDSVLLNFVLKPGVPPPPVCVVGDPLCTENPVPALVVSKSVNPADGSTVAAGQALTYTVMFDNSAGGAAAPIDYVDNWAGVLDDATLTAQPTSSSPTVVIGSSSSTSFSATGTVAAGAKVTITYTVLVKPDGQRGDNVLLNFLLPPGVPPPTVCQPGDPLCTENPVPQTIIMKSASPADGSVVTAGQVLTYTLTFDNSAGKASVPVDYVDDWSGVLDDATVTTQPAASNGALTVSAVTTTSFAVKGTLAAGQTVTVSYAVTVKPDGERGDNDLLNFLLKPGVTTPEQCVIGDQFCTEHPVPELVVSKSANPIDGSTVTAGQTLTYTLTFDNSAGKASSPVSYTDDWSGVLDDATVTSPPVSSNALLKVGNVTTTNFTVSGSVAAGSTTTVTYVVVVKPDSERGNNLLDNFLLPPGVTKPSECLTGDPLCTEHPVPQLVVSKSVNPADGSPVTAGQTLTYTLTFDNSAGGAAVPVNYVDNWAGVLDDAAVTANPTSSDPSLTVSGITGTEFLVKGTIAAKAKVTVTYAVKVKPDDQRGDNVLLNFVVKPGTPPPTVCPVGDPLCTENPVPNLVVMKDVTPADGSTVTAGQSLTYTITFDNSGGGAPASVNYVDDWSGILDDATVTSNPVSTVSSVKVSGVSNTKFTISGTVPAGATATVTYTVVVKADDARGDNTLLNFLLPPGVSKPTTCVVGDPTCTENPVPELVASKSVNPSDGSTVTAGQTVAYTLTFDNSVGKAAAPVNYVDDWSGVLDDAEVTSAPVSSNSSLTVSGVTDTRFTISGSVPAGKTVTVKYSVKVKADGQRGDDVLANFVLEPGKPLPEQCLKGDPLCTDNPVPQAPAIKLEKSIGTVQDVDGNAVYNVGDIVNYRFKVTNVGNTTLTDIVLLDSLLTPNPMDCPKATLAPGESMDCTGPTHTISANDEDKGSVYNRATVTGTAPDGTKVSASDDAELKPVQIVTVTTLPPTGGGSSPTPIALGLLAFGLGLLAVTRVRRRTA